MSFNISRTFITLLIVSQFVTSNRRAIADIMECYRRYMAEILWIRRKTLINLSINHTRYKYFVQQNKIYYILLHPVCHPLDNLPRETMLAWLAFRPLVHVSTIAEWTKVVITPSLHSKIVRTTIPTPERAIS